MAYHSRLFASRKTKADYNNWVTENLDAAIQVADDHGLEIRALGAPHPAFPGIGVFAKKSGRLGKSIEGYHGIRLNFIQFKAKYKEECAIYVLNLEDDNPDDTNSPDLTIK